MINRRDLIALRQVLARHAPSSTPGSKSFKSDLLKNLITAVASGLVGSLLAMGVFSFQFSKQADGWDRQNDIEFKTTVISEKNEIAKELKKLIVMYYKLDEQTSIETNMRVARTSLEISYPGKSKEIMKELPEMMPGDQLREYREISSSLAAMVVPVRIHFGDEIGEKLKGNIFILETYPNNLINPLDLARRLKAMEVNGAPDMDRLYAELKSVVRRRSTPPESLFDEVLADMVESVRRDIKDRQSH